MPTTIEIGAVLQGVGSLGQCIAIFAAAWLAYRGWHKQKIAEKLQEQSERILTATYKARRALEYIRSALVNGYERETARQELIELGHVDPNTNLVTAQVIINRLQNVKDEQILLDECLAMSKALFGVAVEQKNLELIKIFNDIRVAAGVYADIDGSDDKDFRIEMRHIIFDMSRRDARNLITDRIDQTVNTIEAICTPHLRLSANT